MGFFSDKKNNSHITGKLENVKEFVVQKGVDEIYCSLNEITNEQLKELVEFADVNSKTIKFIPDTKEIFSKNLKIDYYEMFPVLSLKKQFYTSLLQKFSREFLILFSL